MYSNYLIILLSGAGLILTGLALRLFVGRNRFNRRRVGGLGHVNSYARALLITIFESFLVFISSLCLIAGVLLLTVYWLS